jgi:hypothetical protein
VSLFQKKSQKNTVDSLQQQWNVPSPFKKKRFLKPNWSENQVLMKKCFEGSERFYKCDLIF